MNVLKIILMALAFVTLQAHAQDDGRNLVVKQNASGGKRIALVIGNGNYHYDNLPKLANPTHDAEDIAKALRGFGFEVIEKKDQSLEGMNDAITEFGRKIADSEAALFYFAGHGLQVKGQNYIIPTNARIESESQVPYQSININQLLDEMDNGKSRANIVMLDACRNNPISGKFRSGATRGLAAPTSQPKGTVIVYATDPGNVAADGSGRNGLFTAGLLTAFKGSDLSLGGVLVRASEEVERGSAQKQTPYINGPATLQKNFQFAPGQGAQIASLMPAPAPAQPARIKSREEIEQDGWESARDSANIDAIQEYLKQYPKGRFAGQAKILMATLKTAPVKPTEPIITPVREDGENDLWTEAQKGNSKDDYDAYLAQHPKGKYIALARSRIKKLEDEAARQAQHEQEAAIQQAAQQEQSAWDSANGSASEASYQGYLNSYPQGRYAILATARIAKLKKEVVQAVANGPKAGQAFRDCPGCPEMVVIPAGSFEMGSPSYEAGRFDNEGSVHRVNISAFAVGKTEITRGQFAEFVSETSYNTGDKCWTIEGGKVEERSGRSWRDPSYRQDDSHPVVCVNWNDAKAYTEWLSRKTGKQYRLPTEAEWEYAARGNSNTARYWGDNPDQACNYENVLEATAKVQVVPNAPSVHNCSDGYIYTAPVGSFKSNPFGLNDMLGNVQELVGDCANQSYNNAPTDGSAQHGGDCVQHMVRGGSWVSMPRYLRSAYRDTFSFRVNYYGFRLVRTLP